MLVAFISYDHPQVMKVLPWSCAVKVVLCVPLKKWLSLLRFAWELDRIEQDNHCHCKSLALALGSWTLISMNLDDWMFKTLSARWVWMTWAISMRRSKCLKSFAKNVEFWAERITSSCNTTWSIVWSPVATFEWRIICLCKLGELKFTICCEPAKGSLCSNCTCYSFEMCRTHRVREALWGCVAGSWMCGKAKLKGGLWQFGWQDLYREFFQEEGAAPLKAGKFRMTRKYGMAQDLLVWILKPILKFVVPTLVP